MTRALGLGRAGVVALLGGSIALACGPETIDLLPLDEARGGSGQSGAGAGTSGAGAASIAGGGHAGGGVGGSSGTSGASAGSGGSRGCEGPGCGGNGFAGSGGLGNCPYGSGCTPCESDLECPDGKVCDPDVKVCVQCSNNEQCLNDRDQSTRYCSGWRCVECLQHSDCTEGDGQRCQLSTLRCVECLQHSDCTEGGRLRCHPSSLRCVECLFDDECDFDQYCKAGHCE